MTIKVAIIGYGAVASIHARQLASEPGVELTTVYGPRREKAQAFALAHEIQHVSDTLADALPLIDVAIIGSPTLKHYQQARECLQAGVHTLVELPPCEDSREAEELSRLAQDHSVLVRCAHTSRYLVPYVRIRETIRAGRLGKIQQLGYIRHHVLRERSWKDNALLHHAAHVLDMLIDWFGGAMALGCVALPRVDDAQTVSLLGKLPGGAPVSISISYASRLPQVQMVIVGEQHTVQTDGFSYIRSDLEDLAFRGDEQMVYERAIHDQDVEFLRAIQGKQSSVDWRETVKLMQTMDRFRSLGNV